MKRNKYTEDMLDSIVKLMFNVILLASYITRDDHQCLIVQNNIVFSKLFSRFSLQNKIINYRLYRMLFDQIKQMAPMS